MYKLGKYVGSDRMSDLICENYSMLLVMSRFGIALGFGDRTIAEVCSEHGVDVQTFLTVVNLMLSEVERPCEELPAVSIEALVGYLHASHDYFLDFRLPSIRSALVEALGESGDVAVVILRYFDEYVAEVRKHMQYEEHTVFPYVRALETGLHSEGYNIGIFRRQHDQVEARLTELKNIIIKYYPGGSTNELNRVLFDIFVCAADLAAHNRIEDELFVPTIEALERRMETRI